MKEIDIIDRLIKEQDLVCYYAIKSYNKSVPIMDVYSENPEILYSQLGRYLLDHNEVLKNFSTKNLFMLLGHNIPNVDTKNQLTEMIMERLKTENFYCEDISDSYFMKIVHFSDISFSTLGKDNIQKVIEQIKMRLQKTEGTIVEEVVEHLNYVADAANFLTYFEKGVFTQEKIELLKSMLKKDENALRYVNFGIFQDDIFKLGPDFIQYISKFPDLSTQLVILQKNNPKLMDVLVNKLGTYENLPDNYEEIEILITYFTKKCFEIDLKEINPKIIKDLTECAIRNSEIFGEVAAINSDEKMINVDYSEEYALKLNEEYENRYKKAENLDAKKNVYLNKMFSLSISGAKKLLQQYGSDLENLSNLTSEEKQAFEQIRQILEMKDETQIDLLYSNGNIVWNVEDILKVRQKIEKECALTYVKEMNKLDDKVMGLIKGEDEEKVSYVEFNGKKIPLIKLNGKFDMLIHSTDSGFIKDVELDENIDFVKLWKNGLNKQNHIISTAFINQDFLGSAPVNKNGVRYGFTSIDEGKIRLMGVTDLNTYSTEFSYNSAEKQYMSAKTMPYNSRRVYSEFGIEREGTIPNYLVIYDDDIEEVVNNSYKAASQFNIPIIYIDKKEIEKEQLQNLENLRLEFDKSKNPELLGKLLNTYETNVAGWLLNRSTDEEDKSHTSDIDNSRFQDDFKSMWTKIQDTFNDYISFTQNEPTRENATQDLVRVMEIILKEIDLYKDCEETKPISKTHISFDARAIIKSINQAFDTIGVSQYKVDLQEIPTLEQYQINMKQIMQNALGGENPITPEDVKQAEIAQIELHNDSNIRRN